MRDEGGGGTYTRDSRRVAGAGGPVNLRSAQRHRRLPTPLAKVAFGSHNHVGRTRSMDLSNEQIQAILEG